MALQINLSLSEDDSLHFTGEVVRARLPADEGKIYYVRFQPRARTNWHEHPGTQILFVLEGRCRVQRQGHPVVELKPNEMLTIPAGEPHWHGAAPDAPMSHIAVNLFSGETKWMHAVSEKEYESK